MPDDTTAPVTAEDLRERLKTVIETVECPHDEIADGALAWDCSDCVADAVVAELAGGPGDLPARMAEAIREGLWQWGQPDAEGTRGVSRWDFLAAKAVSVRWEHAARQAAEVERLRAELAEARRVSHQEIERAMLALIDERDHLRETLAESDLGAQVLAQWEAIAAADADRDRLEVERDGERRRAVVAEEAWARSDRYARRYRLAWQSARGRAAAYGESMTRLSGAWGRAEGERDAVVAAVRTAQITHIRETHPNWPHIASCSGCQVLTSISRAVPSRPDDPEEIRRLAQATTEEGPHVNTAQEVRRGTTVRHIRMAADADGEWLRDCKVTKSSRTDAGSWLIEWRMVGDDTVSGSLLCPPGTPIEIVQAAITEETNDEH